MLVLALMECFVPEAHIGVISHGMATEMWRQAVLPGDGLSVATAVSFVWRCLPKHVHMHMKDMVAMTDADACVLMDVSNLPKG